MSNILFHSKDVLSELTVYQDRVDIKLPLRSKSIPISNISNVENDVIYNKITIKTSGGEDIKYQFMEFIGRKKAKEAVGIILQNLKR